MVISTLLSELGTFGIRSQKLSSATNAHVSHADSSTALGAPGVGSVAVIECHFALKSNTNLAITVTCEKMHIRFVFSIRAVLRERGCRSYFWNHFSRVWHSSLLGYEAVSTHEAAHILEEQAAYLWRVSLDSTDPEDGGRNYLRDICIPIDTASHPKRSEPSSNAIAHAYEPLTSCYEKAEDALLRKWQWVLMGSLQYTVTWTEDGITYHFNNLNI